MSAHAPTDTTNHWTEQRTELEARRAAILAATTRDTAEPTTEPPGTLGETEHLAAYEQRHLDAALEAIHQRELAEIERALARLADGDYGTCATCGAAIAEERLEVLPAAITCVGCPAPPP